MSSTMPLPLPLPLPVCTVIYLCVYFNEFCNFCVPYCVMWCIRKKILRLIQKQREQAKGRICVFLITSAKFMVSPALVYLFACFFVCCQIMQKKLIIIIIKKTTRSMFRNSVERWHIGHERNHRFWWYCRSPRSHYVKVRIGLELRLGGVTVVPVLPSTCLIVTFEFDALCILTICILVCYQ